jgi:Big-like domain-containing protein
LTASVIALGLMAGSPAAAGAGQSAVQLTASESALTVNQPVTLTATVTADADGAAPSGTVTFQNQGKPISGCAGETAAASGQSATAQCTASFGAPRAQLTAVFTSTSGPGSGATSPAVTVPVATSRPSISLHVTRRIQAGKRVTLTAKLSLTAGRTEPLQPSGSVKFSDRGRTVPGCGGRKVSDLSATCSVTYTLPGGHAITATYLGDTNYEPATSGRSSLSITAIPIKGHITATMSWKFFFSPTYSTILSLVAGGLYEGTNVLVGCHGHGCPFGTVTYPVHRPGRCSPSVPSVECPPMVFNLIAGFAGRKLSPGTLVSVMIIHPQYVGKYYGFAMRARQPPIVSIACLAPGSTIPGVACSPGTIATVPQHGHVRPSGLAIAHHR